MSAPTHPTPRPVTTPVKKKSRRPLLLAIAAIFVVIVVVAVMASRKEDPGTPVTVEKAVIKTVTQIVTATGKIQPEVEVKISPEVAGEIIELPVREGDPVKKGALLVKIKPDNYIYQVDQREADLAAAKAMAVQGKSQLFKADEDFKRSKDLFQKKIISDSDYSGTRTLFEAAQANYENALAQIRRAEGLLKQAQDLLEKTTLYAPMDGTISLLSNEVGERVVATGQFAGTEVMRVANLDDMEVRVKVNENDLVNVKVGDKARITIDAYPGRRFAGVVKEIASTATTTAANTQEEVTNFEVRIRISDKAVRLRPGMSANADIETRTVEHVVVVPIQSVTVRSREGNKTLDQMASDRDTKARQGQGDGAASAVNEKQQRENERNDRDNLQRVVFVLNGGTVKQIAVETGISDSTHMEVKSGVKDGEEVVSGSFAVITRVLKDGMKVRVDKPKVANK